MRAVRTSAARRGFTLIELLVAISILAIVAVLGWRGLDGIVRARIALTAEVEATRGMQLAFAQMQSDVEHMADATLLQNRPFLLCDTDRMVMVRNVYHEHEASTLQVVTMTSRALLACSRNPPCNRSTTNLAQPALNARVTSGRWPTPAAAQIDKERLPWT